MKKENEEFKTLIFATGLRLTRFADLCGVTYQQAKDWHSGRSVPKVGALDKLRRHKVSVDKIYNP